MVKNRFELPAKLYEELFWPNGPQTIEELGEIPDAETRYKAWKEEHKDDPPSSLPPLDIIDDGKVYDIFHKDMIMEQHKDDPAACRDRMASLGCESYKRAETDRYSGHHLQIRLPNGTLAIDTYNVTGSTKLGCGLQPSKIDFFEKTKIDQVIQTTAFKRMLPYRK